MIESYEDYLFTHPHPIAPLAPTALVETFLSLFTPSLLAPFRT